MLNLQTKTYNDIMELEPCYDPATRGYITRDWTGTALDVLRMDNVPAVDRLWLALRDGWLPDRLMHEFAIWCAEQALALVENPDPRSLEALKVKRRWLDGDATDEERAAAWSSARSATGAAAATASARSAAWAATGAARSAAWAATGAAAAAEAARSAAWAATAATGAAAWAARSAARSATGAAAATAAARLARSAAAAAAAAAAAEAARLVEMIQESNDESKLV